MKRRYCKRDFSLYLFVKLIDALFMFNFNLRANVIFSNENS